ncbi:MAG: NUDIX hydrolase [Muribaculaceae bacterium]|nr:NUDIX hydrolase [Muribaculaceae bacterium]
MKKIAKWETLESEYLIRRPWLTARRDRVLNPSTGVVNPEFYVLEYPRWVNVIAITGDGRFVMIHQYRYGLGTVETELCAGVVEEGETPEQAGRRELLEETGYGGGEWRELMVVGQNPSTCNNLTHCFVATGVERLDMQHLEPTEEITVELYSREQLLAEMRSGTMHQALMLAPLYRYFYELDRGEKN